MAKRRTKKQKQQAKHRFVYSLPRSGKLASKGAAVKGQKKSVVKSTKSLVQDPKKAHSTATVDSLGTIKRDIVKSLSLASLILGLELVIYLVR